MAKRTKKVGPAGRFQSRYGVRARTRVRNVELVQREKHVCPSCGHQKVKRLDTSIWQCRKCGIKFAGGAYYPRTESGQNVEKMLKGEIEAPKIKVGEPEKEQKTAEEPKKPETPEEIKEELPMQEPSKEAEAEKKGENK